MRENARAASPWLVFVGAVFLQLVPGPGCSSSQPDGGNITGGDGSVIKLDAGHDAPADGATASTGGGGGSAASGAGGAGGPGATAVPAGLSAACKTCEQTKCT